MYGPRRAASGMLLLVALLFTTRESAGQAIGTFRWQFSPFCNVVTLSVQQQGPVFLLSGFDDNCGGPTRSAVTGTAFFNPNGTIGMGLTSIAAGGAIENVILLSSSTLSGPWSDGRGGLGDFTFNPATPASGSPRPTTSAVFAFGQIREDASIRSGSSTLASVQHPGPGLYCLTFSPAPSVVQLEGAVVGLAGGSNSLLFARVTNGQVGGAGCGPGQLDVKIVGPTGSPTDGRFSFVVP